MHHLSGECAEVDSAHRALFSPGNSRADLGRLVAEIFGPRPDGAA